MKTSLTEIQDLLDQEATLANNGQADSEERKKLHTVIRLKRVSPAPVCFG